MSARFVGLMLVIDHVYIWESLPHLYSFIVRDHCIDIFVRFLRERDSAPYVLVLVL